MELDNNIKQAIKNHWASYVPFETAVTGEYIHTYGSLIDCIENEKVKDICWLDKISEDSSDEIINCTLKDSNETFNILVPIQLFEYDKFKKWCKDNKEKIWIDDRHKKTRGIDYFKM